MLIKELLFREGESGQYACFYQWWLRHCSPAFKVSAKKWLILGAYDRDVI